MEIVAQPHQTLRSKPSRRNIFSFFLPLCPPWRLSVGMKMAQRLVTRWRHHLLRTPMTHLQMAANWHLIILYPGFQQQLTYRALCLYRPTNQQPLPSSHSPPPHPGSRHQSNHLMLKLWHQRMKTNTYKPACCVENPHTDSLSDSNILNSCQLEPQEVFVRSRACLSVDSSLSCFYSLWPIQ